MSILPPIHTKYESFLHFRLDCYERALEASLKLEMRQITPEGMKIACGFLRDGSRKKCTFGTQGRLLDDGVSVTRSDETHNCPISRRMRNLGKARGYMKGLIVSMKMKIAAKVEAKDQTIVEVQKEEETSQKKLQVSKETEPEVFPSDTDLEPEISTLMKGGTLSTPSTTEALPTRKILVLLHAWTRQQGFSIYRRCPPSRESFKMFCTRNHPRFSESERGRCYYEITVESDNRDGRWSVKEITGTHNHFVASGFTSTSTSLPRQQAPSPGASTSSKPLESKKRSISEVSSEVPKISSALEAPPPPPLKSRKRSMGPSVLESEPHAFPPVDQTPFSLYPSDLVSFLKSFDSRPSTLLETLSSFDQLGIKSIEVLTTLLSTSGGTFQKFVESVEGVTRDRLEEIALELRKHLARR